ncbi:DEKNAAC104405 [Brettanomyces naardenensis]|uniref:DEKNAAC104405 n=1 Tax=Brettanomyces naardenensis TaxID=13370 RepID=A0A448YQR9_BRENA|nr:DEKNAAC104405 [Brettanomyces naardenensis]
MGFDGEPPAGNGSFQRRQIPLMRFPRSLTYRYWDDLDRDLEVLSDENYSGEVRKGPFGCWRVERITQQRRIRMEEPDREEEVSLPRISPPSEETAEMPMPQSPAVHSATVNPSISNIINGEISTGDTVNTSTAAPGSDDLVPRTIWIHPRLHIDALLTYKAILGDADAECKDPLKLQRVVFSDYYGITEGLRCRIVDKFGMGDEETFRMDEVMAALKVERREATFSGLLKVDKVRDLLRMFGRSCTGLVFLDFKGGVVELLRGKDGLLRGRDILLRQQQQGADDFLPISRDQKRQPSDHLPGQSPDNALTSQHLSDYLYRQLPQTLIIIILSISSFAQYRLLFNSFGLYQGSLSYLRCYIAFREISLVNLSRLILPLIGSYSEDEPITIVDTNLLDTLVSTGLIKHLLLTLILAIKQDECLNIVLNYKLLYTVLQGIREYLMGLDLKSDHELETILTWVKFMHFFFYSSATIDVEHYQIKEPGFEDLDENYNMIKQFKFDDSFLPDEYDKIEIKAGSGEGGEEDDEDHVRLNLPKRLANRPQVVDRPPRSFTVHFGGSRGESGEESSGDSDDDNDDPQNPQEAGGHPNEPTISGKSPLHEQRSLPQDAASAESSKTPASAEWRPLNAKTEINNQGNEVAVLTGLSLKPTKPQHLMSVHKVKQLNIPVPFDINKVDGISSIELSFGIPMSLLDLMIRAVTIANHKNWFLRKKVFPRNFPKFCCDLEEDLMTWKLPWNLYEVLPDSQFRYHSLFHETLYHLIMCFYNTILMFFFRIIKDTDPSLLQSYVSSTLHHLEELRRISLDPGFSKDFKIEPPFWCFFLCGSDAVSRGLQGRYDELGRVWFDAGDKWIGKQMMMEVWRGRNEGGEGREASWLDMIKGWEMSGFD